MSTTSTISWSDLFETSTPSDTTLEVRVLNKSGRPFLLLPTQPTLAAQSLSLYPAQTGFAKLAKVVLRGALQTRLPVPLTKASFTFSRNDPFPKFLADLSGNKSATFPPMAILAGNPRAEGTRFILLLFDEQQQPAFVVKAGIGESALKLIRHEASFLSSTPPKTPGLPLLRASFDAGTISAFALDFIPGRSPTFEDWRAAGRLLGSWINRAEQINIAECPVWQTLGETLSTDPLFRKLTPHLENASFHPAIFHGDFAPWNIRLVADKSWKIIDWERGDLVGIPGWDWFHYLIQTAILVRKQPPEKVMSLIDELLNDASFQNYTTSSGIKSNERFLLVAYLLYLVKIVKPGEGLETNHSLLTLLCKRWLN